MNTCNVLRHFEMKVCTKLHLTDHSDILFPSGETTAVHVNGPYRGERDRRTCQAGIETGFATLSPMLGCLHDAAFLVHQSALQQHLPEGSWKEPSPMDTSVRCDLTLSSHFQVMQRNYWIQSRVCIYSQVINEIRTFTAVMCQNSSL